MSSIPPPKKPWSIDVFQQYRVGLCAFVDTKVVPLIRSGECRRILIDAAVKSGKREISEYTALRDLIAGEPKRVHAFLSAWHRVADDRQRSELQQHNIQVFSINQRSKAEECVKWIQDQIRLGREVVAHLDECDYGTGSRQILGHLWSRIRDNTHVTTVLYSATPEEVLFSGEVEVDVDFDDMVDEIMSAGVVLNYTPPEGFCGPASFLDAGLVEEAKPFFQKVDDTYELTPHGRSICSAMRSSIQQNPVRNILALRLSYCSSGARTERKENKAIYQFLKNIDRFPELRDWLIHVDKDEKYDVPERVLKERIQWDNEQYWRGKTTGVPILIVMDQTSSRSTEWKCHDRVFATHDFRNILNFGTISQAQERVNHYSQNYGGVFQSIRVYGSLKTFQLSARRITYETYLTNEWFCRKVDRRRSGETDMYEVKRTSDNERHPDCPEGGVSRQEADRILQETNSYADPGLSARVKGSIKNVAVVRCEFYPCTPDTFTEVLQREDFREQAGEYTPQNPFRTPRMDGERFQGNLRGEWKVFDYREIESQKRWGFNTNNVHPRNTICYREGQLGIALRTLEGFETQNSLAAFQSMYRR